MKKLLITSLRIQNIFGRKEKPQKKSNDTGTEKKTRKHMEKMQKKALDTNGLCAQGLKIER